MKNSFFVIKYGTTQHLVTVGDLIVVDHLEGNVGDKVTIEEVLLVQSDDAVEIGSPLLEYVVSTEIMAQSKAKKIRVFKYKAKARYRKTRGHRQFQTTLKILKLMKSPANRATKPAQKKVLPVSKSAPVKASLVKAKKSAPKLRVVKKVKSKTVLKKA